MDSRKLVLLANLGDTPDIPPAAVDEENPRHEPAQLPNLAATIGSEEFPVSPEVVKDFLATNSTRGGVRLLASQLKAYIHNPIPCTSQRQSGTFG